MSTPSFHTKAAKDGADRIDGARRRNADAAELLNTIDQVLAEVTRR